ncbi:MAG: DUF4347 domain-containing protein, partial [Magnetococcus sp. DMHC-6]
MKLWPWIHNVLFNRFSTHETPPQSEQTKTPSPLAWRSKLALRLERRLMFDVSGVLSGLAALHHDSHDSGIDSSGHSDDGSYTEPVTSHTPISDAPPHEMIFIDPTVDNYQTLLTGLPQEAQVVILDPNRDGIEQIREALAGQSGVTALHIVSHGDSGSLSLAGSELDRTHLESYSEALQDWGSALTENADILIYGCDVGAGMNGELFLARLAELTGADVAASNDLTGAPEMGGDWNLEVQHGSVETNIFLSKQAQFEFSGVLPSANPIISNLSGDSVNYTEGDPALLIDQGSNASVSDADSPNFNGGTLTVAITANRDPTEDILSIRDQGTGAGKIGVSGSNVTYSGTVIGTFSGGSGTNDLIFSFNASANTTSVRALLRNITYINSDTTNATPSTRSIGFTLTDGSGGTSTTATSSVVVSELNDAPEVNGTSWYMSPILRTDGANATTVSNLFAANDITDNNAGAVEGIAIYNKANDGSGSWQFRVNGGAWSNIGGVNPSSVLLLKSTDEIRYIPNGSDGGQPSLSFYAWDQTSGTAGNKVNPGTRGGSSAFSIDSGTIYETVNAAPVLDNTGTVTMTSITEDDLTNNGQLVSSIIGTRITDIDAGSTAGIAITNTIQDNGTWQYSTNNGGSWTDFGSPTSVTSLLLTSTDRVRFLPDGENPPNDTSPGVVRFDFVAWDRTGESSNWSGGTITSTATTGGATPFSNTTATVSLSVSGVNDAPTLDAGATPVFPTITEDNTGLAGVAVSSLMGGAADVDASTSLGLALYGLNSGNGTWQYNTGSGWTDVGVVSSGSALLLRSTDLIRFVPNTMKATTADISFYAWDQTTGTAGSKVNASTRGTTTAFSLTGDSAAINVTEINDAPTLNMTVSTLSYNEGNAATAVDATLTLTDVDDLNLTGATVQITGNYHSSEDILAFTNQSGITGSWDGVSGTLTLTGSATKAQYQTALSSITYQNTNVVHPNTSNRTVTFTITDNNSDATGAGSLTTSGTRTISITTVNDAPVVSSTASTLSYTEGAGTKIVDTGFSLADVDDDNMAGATVQITGNYLASEDILAFTNQAGITGS